MSACVFWFFIVSLEHNIKNFPTEIPVQAFNLSEELSLTQPLQNVHIKITSKGQDINKIQQSNFRAFVNLENTAKGKHTVNVEVTSENKEIIIVQVTPETLTLELDERASKEVSIDTLIEGNPAEGYQTGSIILSESQAKISGTANQLEHISKVSAKVVLSGTEQREIRSKAQLSVIDEDGNILKHIQVSPQEIEFVLPIVAEEQVKTVGIKPTLTGQLPSGLWLSKITLTPSSIQVKGNKRIIDALETIETEDIILDNLKTSTLKRVNLDFPEGTSPLDDKNINTLLQISVSELSPDQTE